MNKSQILAAMKADAIPTGASGLWYITRGTLREPQAELYRGRKVVIPAGTYTLLYRFTDSTLYRDPPGEVVMEDSPFELSSHLDFVLRARGHVLVSGLGLGCVVRGLLANPDVEHVTCLENSRDILRLVAPHMPTERLTVIEADALAWTAQNNNRFDFAWHDLWTDRDSGEPHLDQWHAKLFANCRNTVSIQGAWAFNRSMKKFMRRSGFRCIG